MEGPGQREADGKVLWRDAGGNVEGLKRIQREKRAMQGP